MIADQRQRYRLVGARGDGAADEVHPRGTNKACDEQVGREVIEVQRRAVLLDDPSAHHRNLVGHGHGLDLVVGHVDHGVAQALVQGGDLTAHGHAQFGVQVGQRLVKQETWVEHHRAANDTLALTARELPRAALQQLLDLQHTRGFGDAAVDLFLGHAQVFQPEGQF